MNNPKHRTQLVFIIMATLLALSISMVLRDAGKAITATDFGTLNGLAQDGKLTEARITGNNVFAKSEDGKLYRATGNHAAMELFIKRLDEQRVKYHISEPSDWSWVFPFLMLALVAFAVFRFLATSGNRLQAMGSSKLQPADPKDKMTFADVAGADEAIEQCSEIVTFLKEPKKFGRLGARVPKGTLFVGPPGTGKTLLARAVAGEAGVPFYYVSGSAFIEMFVGVGASRIRDMFTVARKHTPCIVFIDEIDAVGGRRGGSGVNEHKEHDQTLNQILVEMDGFGPNEGVMIMAATNRPDMLDPALLRKGRFDRIITVDKPDIRGREAILRVHVRKIPLAEDVNLSVIARGTPGFAGAEIGNLVNEAALIAEKAERPSVTAADFDAAREHVIMGGRDRPRAITEKVRRIVAWHEAGHALIGWYEPHADPVHKVSIIPRGQALGVTAYLPLDDQLLHSKDELLARLRTYLGGRVAEEVAFGSITSGASDDLQRATELARAMVLELGMGEPGSVRTFAQQRQRFLGGESSGLHCSEATAEHLDQQINNLLNQAYTEVTKTIIDRRAELDAVAEGLLNLETLTADTLRSLLGPPAYQTRQESA